jgi:hypothetical protein
MVPDKTGCFGPGLALLFFMDMDNFPVEELHRFDTDTGDLHIILEHTKMVADQGDRLW